LLYERNRKPQAYFASKQNAEEWSARFVSGDEQILVEDTPLESTTIYVYKYLL
jgi:hypothetical protein